MRKNMKYPKKAQLKGVSAPHQILPFNVFQLVSLGAQVTFSSTW